MKKVLHIAALALPVLAIGFTVQAHAAATRVLDYTVLRDGKPVGTHSYTISTDGDTTKVAVKTDVQVKVLFVTAYRFEHSSKELWQNGHLVSLTSNTNDDGTDKTLNVTEDNNALDIDSKVKDKKRHMGVALDTMPASLWNPDTVKQSVMLNTLDGELLHIKSKDLGADKVKAHGQMVDAHHYAIQGELTRDLWFDNSGNLVRVSFPDKTGSKIVYALN